MSMRYSPNDGAGSKIVLIKLLMIYGPVSGYFLFPELQYWNRLWLLEKYGNSVCYELDRRVVQCILLLKGCPMCFDIGGLSNELDRRVVQHLSSELIGGLSNGMIYKTKIFCFENNFHTWHCMCT